MVKTVVYETFEQLGQTVQQSSKQLVGEAGKVVEEVAKQTGIKQERGVEQPTQGLTPTQLAKKKEERKRLIRLQKELEVLRQRRAQELPAQVSGKPGFSEEKMIKQLQFEKEEKKKLPPPLELTKKKGGTGERKIMGVSG